MPNLSQKGLLILLERLIPGPEGDFGEGGAEYVLLQRRLIVFFESHGALLAEDLADQTLDRVMRILDEGEREIEDIRRFTLGVARNILRETWKKPHQEPLPESLANQPSPITNPSTDDSDLAELRYQCCQKCLAESFSERDRSLLIGYYQSEGRAKIERHKALARELGVSENALRIRACRLRAKLEERINECCERLAVK
jgi:DNA-directed RNA polymerase specialized sigma24 family protein